ncbi:peptidase domain-containing ABC transporter [Veronia nyctiphanis]|nr:peptidase domain-containing ABC transporter [Veronia nyctiphanis]
MSSAPLKVILQSEVTECGNACLAMVASKFGVELTLPQLRKLNPAEIGAGVNLKDISEVALMAGFHCSPVKFDNDKPEELELPCIVHWGGNHFVVLESVSNDQLKVIDPALGRRIYKRDYFAEMVTGYALELTPNFDKKPDLSNLLSDSGRGIVTFKALQRVMPGFRNNLLLVLLMSFTVVFISMLSPLYVQKVVDEAISKGNLDLLYVLSVVFAAIFLHEVVFSYVAEITKVSLRNRLKEKLTTSIFAKLIYLPIDYFNRRTTGDSLSRIGSAEGITHYMVDGVIVIVTSTVMIALSISVMLYFNVLLSVLSVLVMLVFALSKYLFKRSVIHVEKQLINDRVKSDSLAIDIIKSIKTIKSYSSEFRKNNTWSSFFSSYIAQDIKKAKIDIHIGILSKLFLYSELLLIVTLGGYLVIKGDMTVGTMFAFILYKNIFTEEVIKLVEMLIVKQSIEVHLERVNDIIDHESEVEDLARNEKTIERQVTFPVSKAINLADGVSVNVNQLDYQPAGAPHKILKNVNLKIDKGEKVCIIGKTGSGKTTLTSIISGLFRQSTGTVELEKVDTLSLNPVAHRALTSTLSQDDEIFAGSIEENITLSPYDIDYDYLDYVCKLSLIDKDIEKMTVGYKTLLSDNSGFLSAGQKQRLLIARALYQKPRLLILDEFTSNLDERTSKRLVDNIIKHVKCTLIVISHDTSIMTRFDSAYLVSNGRLRKLRHREVNHVSD